MIRKLFLLVAFLVAGAVPAHAQWKQATSSNFIIYSDGSEAELRQATERLERYHHVLRVMSGINKPPSNIKIKIYMLPNLYGVQELAGPGVGGFYLATPRAPVAVTPRRIPVTQSLMRTDVDQNAKIYGAHVLQHELTHHFMYQYFPTNYPTWYSEGFAEYYGAMDFPEANVLELGHAPPGRVDQLRSDWLPMDKLLTAKSYDDVGDRLISLYAQGWLLVHYAASNSERGKQLRQYLAAVAAGQPYDVAAKAAFGDLKKLDSDLRNYSRSGLKALRFPLKPINTGAVEVRTLTPIESELLRSDMLLNLGLPVRQAKQVVSDTESKAARAQDAYALRVLTEMQRAAEKRDAAKVSVDRWLAIAPNDPKALMNKAEMQIEDLVAAKSTDVAAWEAARALIMKANKLAPQDPEVLIAYYNSYDAQGVLPPAPAQNALMTAHKLVPQVDALTQRVAADFEARGMIEEAIFMIKPVASGLHSGKENDPLEKAKRERQWKRFRSARAKFMETPREMLARLEQKLAQQTGGKATAAKSGGF